MKVASNIMLTGRLGSTTGLDFESICLSMSTAWYQHCTIDIVAHETPDLFLKVIGIVDALNVPETTR